MLTLANLISDFGKNTANSSTTTKHFNPKQVGVDYGWNHMSQKIGAKQGRKRRGKQTAIKNQIEKEEKTIKR
jgi:hypothetical protein